MKKVLVWRGREFGYVVGEVRSTIDVVNLFLEDVEGNLEDMTEEELEAAKTPEEAVEAINRHFDKYSLEEEEEGEESKIKRRNANDKTD